MNAAQPTLVAGLGNPGPRYAGNRHNIGFLVADELADRMGGKFKARWGAAVVDGRSATNRIVLVKPSGFMNNSGGAVTNAAKFYKLGPDRVVVVHDELDLPFGTIRLKRGGGENGHNGLRSISKSLGTKDYLRVRFGIGRPPGRMDPADFVLRDFSSTERKELGVAIASCADAVEMLLSDGLELAQNTFHAG